MNNNQNIIKFFLYAFTSLIIIGALVLSLNYFARREKDILSYADSSDLYNVSFNLNGATYVDKVKLNCDNSKCLITLPNAHRDNGVILGYSNNKNDIEATYQIGETVEIKRDMVFYVISYEEKTLYIGKNNVDYLEKEKVSCKAFNKDTSCNVTIPSYNKIGYENKGYSTSSDSLTGYIYAGSSYRISKNTILYPIYSYTNHLKKLDIREIHVLKDTFIEIEDSCKPSTANQYLEYLNSINKEMPFLLIGNKISFIGSSIFTEIWGSNYAGMNFGPKGLRSVDVRCSTIPNNDYYGTMVHEMAHTWDFYYATKFNSNITNQNDIINLYSKYQKMANRPFREYSYSNIYEFFADMVKYYYFKYQIKKIEYKEMDYPSDIKDVLEKYLCIAQNNYDKTKCS